MQNIIIRFGSIGGMGASCKGKLARIVPNGVNACLVPAQNISSQAISHHDHSAPIMEVQRLADPVKKCREGLLRTELHGDEQVGDIPIQSGALIPAPLGGRQAVGGDGQGQPESAQGAAEFLCSGQEIGGIA